MVDFQDNRQEFSMKNLLPEPCRAARGLLNWTQEKLAVLAGVSRSTVRDFENGTPHLHRSTAAVLVDTLENAGMRLLSDQREVGIQLRRLPLPATRTGRKGCCTGELRKCLGP